MAVGLDGNKPKRTVVAGIEFGGVILSFVRILSVVIH